MSYPQQPMPDQNPIGEPAPPVAEMVGQPSHPSPPSVTGPLFQPFGGGQAPPPSRPVGIVVGAIGMFAIGFGYLVVIVLNLFSMVRSWELLDREPAFLVAELGVLLTQLIVVAITVTGGALVLMNKPLGRVLSFVVVGGVLLVACQSATRDAGWLFAYGAHGSWLSQVVFVLLSLVLFIVSVVVVVMLAPQRVEEWLRNRHHPASPGLPVQQPIGQAPMVQQTPIAPPVPEQQPSAVQPTGQPYSGPPAPTDYRPPQPPA